MQGRSTQTVGPDMPLARLLSRSHLTVAVTYVAGYVLLDWISFVHPFGPFGITPWNPQTGLSFTLVLLFGLEFVPWLFVAPFLADLIVRQLPLPVVTEFFMVLTSGAGYGSASGLLMSARVGFDVRLSTKRSLLLLMAFTLASAALVALVRFLVLRTSGIVSSGDFFQVALRAFVGDMIGVMIFTPFLLILITRSRFPRFSWEVVLLAALIIAAIAGVFAVAVSFRLQFFYLLFIPIVWTAVRFGLEGVSSMLVVAQIGLIAAIQISGQSAIDIVSYQALMVVLAVTGLAIGVLVNEQQRTQQQLRLQQDALNRASRLGTMGEFAAAVAHEINQPLTAIANFTRLAKSAAEAQPPNAAAIVEATSSAIEQVDRAASVVRGLRDFIRLGRSQIEPVTVARLASETQSFCRADLDRFGIELETRLERDLPRVKADPLQIEQVLVNLVRNSAEALAQAGRQDGHVRIEAARETGGRVLIRVVDNGPGLDPDLAEAPIVPFTSTKGDGLGLGLSLSRSIIEAHGGRLKIDSGPGGVVASFSLPAVESAEAVS